MAGHSYLAVTDTGFDAGGSIYNAISLDELNTIIRGCKANLKLRFFDACQCGESFSKEFASDHKMTETMKKQFLESGNGLPFVLVILMNIQKSCPDCIMELLHIVY